MPVVADRVPPRVGASIRPVLDADPVPARSASPSGYGTIKAAVSGGHVFR
jgi:hypothetical protein